MAVNPRNCVFATAFCYDDGAGNQGGCIASYYLGGLGARSALDIFIHDDWRGYLEVGVLDVVRDDDTLLVLVGLGGTLTFSGQIAPNTTWYEELRIYGVDASDPANMVALPGYIDLTARCTQRTTGKSYSGFYGNSHMVIDADGATVRLHVAQIASYGAQGTNLEADMLAYRTGGGWPLAYLQKVGFINLYAPLPFSAAGWTQFNHAADNQIVQAHDGAVRYDGSAVIEPPDGPAGGAACGIEDYTFYIEEDFVMVATESHTGHPSVEYFDQSGTVRPYNERYAPQYTAALAHRQGDDVLCWVAGGPLLTAWSVEDETYSYSFEPYSPMRVITDLDRAGDWLAAKILVWSGTEPEAHYLWAEVDLTRMHKWPAWVNRSISGLAWGGGVSYTLRSWGYGIVAGVPTGGKKVDTFTDPTGIEWTVLLKDSNILVIRPETSSTYASPVTVDDSGDYDSVSITGDGTVVTIEARKAEDETLWRWRSNRYALDETWGSATEVATV